MTTTTLWRNRDTWDKTYGLSTDPAAARRLIGEFAGPGRAAELIIHPGSALPLDDTVRTTIACGSRQGARTVLAPAPSGPQEHSYQACLITGIGLFCLSTRAEQDQALAAAAARTTPGGHLIVEMPAAFEAWQENARCRTLDIQPDSVLLLFRRTDAATRSVQEAVVRLTNGRPPLVESWSGRFLTPDELDLMAQACGFTPLARWSDWSRTPFGSASTTVVSVYRHG